jgi:hypothetical protein
VVNVRKQTPKEGDNILLVSEHELVDAYVKDMAPRVNDTLTMLEYVAGVKEKTDYGEKPLTTRFRA